MYKKLKIAILISLIIIISIIIILSQLKLENEESSIDIEEKEPDSTPTKLEFLQDDNMYFTIQNCIQEYLEYIIINYNTLDRQYDESLLSLESRAPIIYDLLSKEYINKNNITVNNIYENVNYIENYSIFLPLEIKVLYGEEINTYVVHGIIEEAENNKFIEEAYFFVYIDSDNRTFSIEPILNKNYKSIDDLNVKEMTERISKNNYNIYNVELLKTSDMAIKYLVNYKKLMLYYPEKAFETLDKEYREKRFGTLNEYKEYIEKNKEDLEKINPAKYMLNTTENNIEYICKDQYERTYIFDVISTMRYTLRLDTYTIESETFKQEYEQANEQTKVLMNIDKWIDMLNNRDYKTAYSVLDETFRNNNFGSEEKFEEYMREKFPGHYKLNYGNYEKQGQNNVQEVVLTQIVEDEVGSVSTSVVMKLLEGTNFVMSFNII